MIAANDNAAPIPGFDSFYMVTNDGRVFSFPRVDARGHQRRGKWLKPIPDGDGYPRVHLCVNGSRRKWQIHRLVALAFLPNNDNKPAVNHKDGVKTNNNVSNLEWVTVRENVIHAIGAGLFNVGRDPETGRFLKEKQCQ